MKNVKKGSQEKLVDSKAATRVEECKFECANRNAFIRVNGHLEVSKREQASESGTVRLSEPSKQRSQAELGSHEAEPANAQSGSMLPAQSPAGRKCSLPLSAEPREKHLVVDVRETGGKSLVAKALRITPQGLAGSRRNAQDGIVYFGNSEQNYSGHTNDFSLPEQLSGLGPKHFKIFYNTEDNEYYIQDLEEGTGTFLRIEKNYVRFRLG